MTRIEIEDASTHLAALVARVQAGEEVTLVEKGEDRARLLATGLVARRPPRWGLLAGKARVPANFDAPLPDDLLDLFEGR